MDRASVWPHMSRNDMDDGTERKATWEPAPDVERKDTGDRLTAEDVEEITNALAPGAGVLKDASDATSEEWVKKGVEGAWDQSQRTAKAAEGSDATVWTQEELRTIEAERRGRDVDAVSAPSAAVEKEEDGQETASWGFDGSETEEKALHDLSAEELYDLAAEVFDVTRERVENVFGQIEAGEPEADGKTSKASTPMRDMVAELQADDGPDTQELAEALAEELNVPVADVLDGFEELQGEGGDEEEEASARDDEEKDVEAIAEDIASEDADHGEVAGHVGDTVDALAQVFQVDREQAVEVLAGLSDT